MLQSLKALRGYSLQTPLGKAGRIDDFYFDDEIMTVRFVVLTIGGWLNRRKILLEPCVLNATDHPSRTLSTLLTPGEVKSAPHYDTHMPVSRQKEAETTRVAWRNIVMEAAYVPSLGALASLTIQDEVGRTMTAENDVGSTSLEGGSPRAECWDPHLRSVVEVIGYDIRAPYESGQKPSGRVLDFLVDDLTWRIALVRARTTSGRRGHDYTFPAELVARVEWEQDLVIVAAPPDRSQKRISPIYALPRDGGVEQSPVQPLLQETV